MTQFTKITSLLVATTLLGACGTVDRLSNVGKAPTLSAIENPAQSNSVRQVSMPMPAQIEAKKQANSLWSSDKSSFFEDQRASQVGDILTVMIDINDQAELENETERTRTNSENANLAALLGYEGSLSDILPEAIDPENLANFGSNSVSRGQGNIEREEEIRVRLAAVVTDILPNGNMVVVGRQEVRVNFEKRVLELAGIIRPEDITVDNTIPYDQVAEARVSYGGEGQITDVQQPRYGQQVYDILFPF